MASTFNVLLCAALATLFWGSVGLPIARRLVPGTGLVWAIAPLLGWAVHSAVALPLFHGIGFTAASVRGVAVLSLVFACAALFWRTKAADSTADRQSLPVWVWAAAALLALAPLIAILPKVIEGGVVLAAPIFDHSKIAMVDEMVRAGLPPGNPYFGNAEPGRLAYYYLWHFSAAELALALGIGGWEADAALTGFTAFASLMVMIGLAVWLSGRASAALWVILFGLTGSLRPILSGFSYDQSLSPILSTESGLSNWLYQVSWAPQHVMSASCVVLAFVFILRLAQQSHVLLAPALGLVVAAGFGSSTWVGGVTFAIAAPAMGLVVLMQSPSHDRMAFLWRCAFAALLALLLASPFLREQFAATAAREGGSPIAFHPYSVLGTVFPEGLRAILDLPAYWLVLLPLEFPAVAIAGLTALVCFARSSALNQTRGRFLRALAAAALACFCVSWLLASTIGNNDLGWRAILPGLMILTVVAGAGLSHWLADRRWKAATATFVAFLLGLPYGVILMRDNVLGYRNADAAAFTQTPAMWEAVRRHAGPLERVANNPLFLKSMTPWAANISWALMANRRSCYAGWELAIAFAPISKTQRAAFDAQFLRVFDGQSTPDDVRDLAQRSGCQVAVITAQDGAWNHDPFASSPHYRLVEDRAGAWRIYRRVAE